jgi:hypothetical protein
MSDTLPPRTATRSGAGALGLAEAARMAAVLSGEIARADPDPDLLVALADRSLRVPPQLFTRPTRVLTAGVLADWRRTQALLGRRLSSPVREDLLRIGGYLSFYLGVLAVDTGDDASARRFATLAEQHAERLADPLLAGTTAGLDATIALASGRPLAALTCARRMATGRQPHLLGWATLFEAYAAAAAGEPELAGGALRRLLDRADPPSARAGTPTGAAGPGVAQPGWPPLDPGWSRCLHASVLLMLQDPSAAAAARAAVDATEAGSPQRGWALAALAAAAMRSAPGDAETALTEIADILDSRPSHLLVEWLSGAIRRQFRPRDDVPPPCSGRPVGRPGPAAG